MTPDKILTSTFADHEHLAPDPEATLADVRDRLDRPHRTGPVLAVAAAVVAVVAGAVVVADRPAPAPTQAASRPAATSAPAAPVDKPVTFAAGWLPPGRVESVLAGVEFADRYRGYQVTPPDGPGLYVTMRTTPGTALPTENKRGHAVDLVVGGRPAREWAVQDWYTLAVLRPGGVLLTLDLSADSDAGHVDAATLAAMGRRVTADLDLTRTEAVRPSFTLTTLPTGTGVRAVVTSFGRTEYVVAGPNATATRPGPHAVAVREQAEVWATDIGKPRQKAARGETVLGRPTHVLSTGELWVDGIRPGRSVLLSPAGPGTTPADLYRVARGIRWTG